MTLAEVYEKYKHLDSLFTDPRLRPCSFEGMILYELWEAVKAEMEKKG